MGLLFLLMYPVAVLFLLFASDDYDDWIEMSRHLGLGFFKSLSNFVTF